jgi:Tol biopolymer transport system component
MRLVWPLVVAVLIASAAASAGYGAVENGMIAFTGVFGSSNDRNVDGDGNWEVGVANADGSGVVNLTRHPAVDGNPDWSPDGSRIVFESDRTGGGDLYVMDADGSDVRRLTRDPREDSRPAFSPDGRWIAFSRGTRDDLGLYVMRAGGGGARRLVDGGFRATWSPDGRWLAYDRLNSIWVIRRDGTMRRRLTNGEGDVEPAWSPDGRTIVFARYMATADLYTVRAAGGRPRRLTRDPGDEASPAWSPDGTQILFVNLGARLYVIRRDGSGSRLVPIGPRVYDADWQSVPSAARSFAGRALA